MDISIYSQLFNLLIFFLTGIVIGILFDVFRITRKSFKTPDFVTYIEDILFWILTGLILLFTIFKFNNGELRIYIFVGLILGMVIYLLTISKYFIKISVLILKFIKKITYVPIQFIFRVVKRFIIRPISFIIKKMREKVSIKKFFSINKTESDKINE